MNRSYTHRNVPGHYYEKSATRCKDLKISCITRNSLSKTWSSQKLLLNAILGDENKNERFGAREQERERACARRAVARDYLNPQTLVGPAGGLAGWRVDGRRVEGVGGQPWRSRPNNFPFPGTPRRRSPCLHGASRYWTRRDAPRSDAIDRDLAH